MYIKIDGAENEQFRGVDIILFGASSTGEKAIEEFKRIGSHILGFCDNSNLKQGTRFCDYYIFSPSEVKCMVRKDPKICVMITSTYEKEIARQLEDMNIDNYYVVHMGVLHDKLSFSEFSNEILSEDQANETMSRLILSQTPCFIGRVGSTELETICNYKYFTGRIDGKKEPYTNNITKMLCDWCGFFPPNHLLMDRFCELYLDIIKDADLLWCMWQSKYEDRLFRDCCPNTVLSLYDETGFPIYSKNPWTSALKGKKVLVIHPFVESININYKIKDKLFSNPYFLPDFELITLKAVQTLADNKDVPFSDWFEALYSMQQQMKNIDFDVALIGAGAYGFPLGAFAKKMGKQAFHIGGMLQLYFGIRGKYYDKFEYHNQYWTRPLEEEKPKGFVKVEAGRYW